MNKEEAKQLRDLLDGFIDGKTIQRGNSIDGRWCDDPTPDFNANWRWRVKPEPRTFWVYEADIGNGTLSYCPPKDNKEYWVKLVEVTE